MTKKTRSLNRWKQRWWQLMDNGYIFYFKSDCRLKVLGQIDIARTCYDVRLGSDQCRVDFPRAAPSCCCISFAVLKRTYYVYTPTAGEAKKWAQAISNMSRVINRKIVAGVERRKAPDPPGGLSRPPSCPPDHRVRMTRVRMHNRQQPGMSDSYEDFTRIQYVKRSSNLKSTKEMAASVPNYLNKIVDDNISLDGSLDSRLWLDGSPPPIDNPPVYPQHAESVADLSWASPQHESSSSPATDEQTSLSSTRGGEQTILAAAMGLEGQQLQPEVDAGENGGFYQRSVSMNNILSLPSEGEGESTELQPRSNSLNAQQERPVPKPRKGKARHADSEQKLEGDRTSTSSLQPHVRPRTNSEVSSSKKSNRPSSLGMRPRKGSGLPKRKLSPPTLPPPPPPVLQSPSLQPPTVILTPPEPPRRCNSGPPKFIPPPPPQSPPPVTD